MPNPSYYPAISDRISVNDLPDILSFLKSGIQQVFDELYYKNLQISNSVKGDNAFYSLELVSKTRLELEVPGTGIYLILNPDHEIVNISSFPITLNWEWGILKYKRHFDLSQFSFTPKDFFLLLIEIMEIDVEDLLDLILRVFVIPTSVSVSRFAQLQADINAHHISSININELSSTRIEDLNGAIHALGENTYLTLFYIYLLNTDLQTTKNNLNYLFSNFIPTDFESFFQDLFVPKAKATLELSAAVEFPRKWLQPVYDASGINPYDNLISGNPYEVVPPDVDDIPKVRLQFGNAFFSAGTQGGLESTADLVLNTNVPAQIGNTGLILNITNAKLDISRIRNIEEANLDGRPTDFVGVYMHQIDIILPEKWFKQESTTLGIFGRNLLIGTGGISGNIGLETIGSTNDVELLFTLGKKPISGPRKGFQIGFSQFQMVWQQNALIESKVKGSLSIPKFKQCIKQSDGTWTNQGAELKIDIEAIFEQDGDFEITAKPTLGLSFCLDGVFIVTLKELSIGREDDVYIELAGSILFDNNTALKEIISEPIEITEFRIYENGSFELKGGKVPLPKNVTAKIGPAEISISAIHLGSHEQTYNGDDRQYKYFGLDAAVGVDPGGVQAEGKGLKFFFTVDDEEKGLANHQYLSIESLSIDLIVPGDVDPEDATLIASGYLALQQEEYAGSISFMLPKVKMAGGAGMRYNKKHPAFLIDAFLELSTGIPLANTGLAFFGFRGLFGLKYYPYKEEEESWVDFYNKAPEKGIHISKFRTPDGVPPSDSKTVSIGAGASLATQADDGKAFSSQLFLLLSLRNLIILEGKANVMGTRLGLTSGNAPFIAMLVLDLEESIRIGMGVNYLLPREGSDAGKILVLKGEIDSVFYFKNNKAWYVHIGTKDTPITARLFDLFDCYSYLMLDANGLETGAGISFGFDKKYAGGVVKASVNVYFDVWGRISFTNPQIGGGIALGGGVAVTLFGVGFYLSVDTLLTVEVPQPFRIYGKVDLCVGVKLLVKRIEKCFTVEFVWERKDPLPLSLLYPLPSVAVHSEVSPAKGIHMLSGKEYSIDYFGTDASFSLTSITTYLPLDTHIDILIEHNVNPSPINHLISGFSNAGSSHIEVIPPIKGDRQQRHSYSITDITIEVHDGNSWQTYDPYTAIDANVNSNFKMGSWQKSDNGNNKIRLLGQTPFSYTQNGQAGWYTPAQMGVSGQTLYCEATKKVRTCIEWYDFANNNLVQNKIYSHQGMAFRIKKANGKIDQNQNKLCFKNGGCVEFYFLKSIYDIRLHLTTSSHRNVEITYYREKWIDNNGTKEKKYEEISNLSLTSADLTNGINYTIPSNGLSESELISEGVDKIVIRTSSCKEDMENLEEELDALWDAYYLEVDAKSAKDLKKKIDSLQKKYEANKDSCCDYSVKEKHLNFESLAQELEKLFIEQKEIREFIKKNCQPKEEQKIKPNQSRTNSTNLKNLDKSKLVNRSESKDNKDCKQKKKQLNVLNNRIKEILVIFDENSSNSDIGKLIKEKISLEAYIKKNCLVRENDGMIADTIKESGQKKVKTSKLSPAKKKISSKLSKKCILKIEELRKVQDGILSVLEVISVVQTEGQQCHTCIEEVCWMTVEDHIYNINIPSQAEIDEDYQLMKEALENTIAPIWRPDSSFRVKVTLEDDALDYDGSPDSGTESFYFGFKTAGPLGHFPENKIKIEQNLIPDNTSSDPNVMKDLGSLKDPKLESFENRLKYYLDNHKSYPTTDGDLLYAKPLYYKDQYPAVNGQESSPRLLIFFKKDYAHHFFLQWPGIISDNEMIVDIIDPTETSDSMAASITSSIIEVKASDYFDVNEMYPDISLINNIPKNCIVVGGDAIEPKIHFLSVTVEHLKPLKLYSALIKNKYNGNTATVHQYNFQTSQYASFQEHMNSFILSLADDGTILRTALFYESWNLSNAQVNDAWSILNGAQIGNTLDNIYTDDFEKLIVGVCEIVAFDPPITTELNIIKSDADNAVGIWLRSNEPFNDPRTPKLELENTIEIFENGSTIPSSNYKHIYSKDATEIFIMKNNGSDIGTSDLVIKVKLILWNGKEYELIDEYNFPSLDLSI